MILNQKARTSIRFALAILAALAVATPAAAEIEAKADAVLKKMSALLKSSQQFTFTARTIRDVPTSAGVLLHLAHKIDIALRRPNGIRATMKGDVADREFWYDGATITLLDVANQRYAADKAPATIDAAIDFAAELYGADLPLADFFYSDPYAVLTENVRAGFYVGLRKLDGVMTHHLAFVQEGLHWQIWIDDGERALPRKFAIAYTDLPGMPRFTAHLSGWNLKPKLSAGRFKPVLPAGVQKVKFIAPLE